MMDGVFDSLKIIGSMVYNYHFISLVPDKDNDGKSIPKSVFIKRFKQQVKAGEIVRYYMHKKISPLPSHKELDEYINTCRQQEVDRLNEKYYGQEKYLKIKQCM